MSQVEKLPESLLPLLENTPHALLLEGATGEVAKTFAHTLLKTNKENPPDLRNLYPEGKAHHHPMQAIKQLIEEASLPPFEAEKKVFIIHEAEKMLPSSSNALLKTLEEPLPGVIIILVTSYPERLLPTITSRCFHVPLSVKEEADEHLLKEKMFHVGFRLLRGDLPTSKELPEISLMEEALSYLFYFYRDLHLLKVGGDPSLLFYQDKREVLEEIQAPLPPLEAIEEKIEEAMRAGEVHLPLSSALPKFIF